MSTETQNNSERLLSALRESGDGLHKSASAGTTNVIRKNIQELSVLRKYHPLVMKSENDLIPALEHDEPLIREVMESDALGAVSVPFSQNSEMEFYHLRKFDIRFNPIITPTLTKDLFQLMAMKNVDLTKMIVERNLRYVHTVEDQTWFQGLYNCAGPINGVGLSGYQQHFGINDGISRDTYPEVLNGLEDFNLNNGTIIMNRRTAKAFLKWGRDEIGGDLAESLMRKGTSALIDAELFGVRHIITIKRDLVPDGRVIVLAPPEYFMRYYGLQDLTMYVKKEKHWIHTSAMQVTGMAFANVFGVVVYDFATA